jgi:MFS family permease
LTCTFLGFTKSYGGLIAARFFLGMFEGGLIGGLIVYLALFYRRHQMLYRIGLFACAAPLSIAFGGLLATGLAKIDYHGYKGKYSSIYLIAMSGLTSSQAGHGYSS